MTIRYASGVISRTSAADEDTQGERRLGKDIPVVQGLYRDPSLVRTEGCLPSYTCGDIHQQGYRGDEGAHIGRPVQAVVGEPPRQGAPRRHAPRLRFVLREHYRPFLPANPQGLLARDRTVCRLSDRTGSQVPDTGGNGQDPGFAYPRRQGTGEVDQRQSRGQP